MAGAQTAGIAGTLVRAFVGVCFVGGALSAVAGRLVVAGVAFLVGHTFLATAAVVAGQRRRGAGLSVSGLGWFVLAVALGAGDQSGGTSAVPETPLLIAGFALVTVGTLLVVVAFGAGASRREASVER